MRTVDAQLLGDKMDEAVTHYINSHQSDEAVHVDVNALALNVQEDATRLNMLQTQNFTPHLCRQVPVNEHETEGQWTEELLDPDGRLAALMAHFAAQPRAAPPSNHKDSVRSDVDTVILDSSMRLFNGPPLDQSSGPLVVEVPPLPPLQGIKRCQETDWFHDKAKSTLKTNNAIVTESEGVLEIAQSKQQNKKSLPHKKRISRKLKKGNGDTTPQQDIVVLSCTAEQQEEILPDSFAAGTLQQSHHMAQQVRPMFICQLCGEYYGEEQLKFYQHLKQHYEPHGTIIIENPVPDLPIDKITNSCIVDNGATLPDSIVELSLENTVPKTIYQTIDKHMLYTTHDKTLNYTNNKVLYSVASMDKEPEQVVSPEEEKTDLYETLDKLQFYSCVKCNKVFRKQKECEEHIKEAHSHPKLEEMGEFSEPEDLMEGIHVSVDEATEQYEQSLLPHLTVDSGHVTQEHARYWYVRGSSGGTTAPCGPSSLCPLCPHAEAAPETHQLKVLKEEVLQRILESDVTSEAATFSETMIAESDPPAAPSRPPTPPPPPPPEPRPPSTPLPTDPKEKPPKKFECVQCGKSFKHRNSLIYHTLSHSSKQHTCRECGKGFYTASALKIHKRVHNGDKPHKCDVCGRDFRQWSDLTYHKISKHSDVKMFKCEYCGKEFARKYSLNVHRRIHTGERNYKCEYCTKSFSASSYRLSHMRTHTGVRPYKCNQCEKCFRVAGDLRRHSLIHDKARATAARLDHPRQKTKPKEPDEDIKKDADPIQKTVTKKIAVASTTKGPNFKGDKKPQTKPKKAQDAKKGAPNVTIDQMDSSYTNNVEVFDTRQGYDYGKELGHALPGEERDMTILRPTFNGACDTDKPILRPDNTDGKMQIYTHIKKTKLHNKEFSCLVNTQSDLRDQPDTTETGFIERLTALYNISAV